MVGVQSEDSGWQLYVCRMAIRLHWESNELDGIDISNFRDIAPLVYFLEDLCFDFQNSSLILIRPLKERCSLYRRSKYSEILG